MNKRMIAILSALVIFCCCAFSVHAAGQGEVKEEQVRLIVWHGTWWDKQAPVLAQAYHEEFPQVELVIETFPFSDYVDKASSAILGGSPPDVLSLDATMIPTLAGRKLLQPWPNATQEDFAAAVWQAGILDGTVFAIPYRASSLAYYFNNGMFDAAGLGYPLDNWNVGQFLEMAKKLTVQDKQWGFGLAVSSDEPTHIMGQLAEAVWSSGGDFLRDNKCTMDDPKAINGLRFWSDLYLVHKVVPPGSIGYTLSDERDLFLENVVAMFGPMSEAAYSYLKEKAPAKAVKFGIVKSPHQVSRGGGWSHTVPVGAKHPEDARQYIRWFTATENLAKYTIRMPARASAATYAPWNNEVYSKYLSYMQETRLLPVIPQWNDIQTIIMREMQRVLLKETTVQEAAGKITAEADRLLK